MTTPTERDRDLAREIVADDDFKRGLIRTYAKWREAEDGLLAGEVTTLRVDNGLVDAIAALLAEKRGDVPPNVIEATHRVQDDAKASMLKHLAPLFTPPQGIQAMVEGAVERIYKIAFPPESDTPVGFFNQLAAKVIREELSSALAPLGQVRGILTGANEEKDPLGDRGSFEDLGRYVYPERIERALALLDGVPTVDVGKAVEQLRKAKESAALIADDKTPRPSDDGCDTVFYIDAALKALGQEEKHGDS